MIGPDGRPESPSGGGAFWKLRIPFIHYPIDKAMFVTGLINSASATGIAAIWSSTLGIPLDICISMFVFTFMIYLIPTFFGDPAQHGAITAGTPLYITWLMHFEQGPDRIHAVVAMQLCLAAILILLSLTGSAGRIARMVPDSVKAGILLGAAVSSGIRLLSPSEKYMQTAPVSVLCAVLVVLFIMFSARVRRWGEKVPAVNRLAGFSVTFGMLTALVVGLLSGEVSIPRDLTAHFFTPLNTEWIRDNLSVFGIGFPPARFFLSAFPMALVAWILCFGDVLVVETLIGDVNASPNRTHEYVRFSVNRNYLFCGLRNIVHGLFLPYMTMCGPAYVAGTAMTCQRTKLADKKTLSMYWSANASVLWGELVAFLIFPVITFWSAIATQSAAINFMIQCFVCSYAALGLCKTDTARGIAGVMAAALIAADYVELFGSGFFAAPVVGLAVGIVLHLLLERNGEKTSREAGG